MAKPSSAYRAAVWRILSDGEWHSGLRLAVVGGLRFGARVHELRHEDRRRIVCRVVDSESLYRYVCDCGPLPRPGEATALTPRCSLCEGLPELAERRAA